MRKCMLAAITAFLCLLFFGYAFAQDGMQEKPLVITYLAGNVDVDRTPDNDVEDFTIAELEMEVPRGSIVRTGRDAYCELTLHDGSIIRIAPASVFKIDDVSYNEETGRKRGKFNLLFGRVKATVSKLTTSDSEFEVRSGTSLAGVRGTTFGVFFDGEQAQVLVFEGSVSLESITEAFEPVVIKKGNITTVPSDGLAEPVSRISKEMLQEWDEQFRIFSDAAQPYAQEVPEAEKAGRKYLDLAASFGGMTIDNTFYNRWVFYTEYNRNKFGFGIYLPAIFSFEDGFFSFNEWYNYDEWDFTNFQDIIHDLLIKIYYLKYGEYGDPFYVRLGSIDTFNLHYGFIVNDYTNMLFFPQELSSGVVLNADVKYVGLETFAARIDEGLQTSGARAYVRPFAKRFPLYFGGSVFYDWPKPESSSWPAGTANENQLPRILIVGADTGLPLFRRDAFTLGLYADIARVGFQYDELHPSLVGMGVQEGKVEFLKGLGTAFGVAGTAVSVVDYRAEYRYIMDYYEPGIINFNWDNRRLTYQQELLTLIQNQTDPMYVSENTGGFYLSAGLKLLKQRLSLGLGYGNYKKHTGVATEAVDQGQFYLVLKEGLIPRTWGDFTYNRDDNVSGVLKDFIDDNTLLDTNLYYRVAPMLILSLNIKRTYQYNDVTGQYDPIDSFRINTIVSF